MTMMRGMMYVVFILSRSDDFGGDGCDGGKYPIHAQTGIFLKSVYFLQSELTKCAITGVIVNRNNSLGILIKGKKGVVFWSYDSFFQLCGGLNYVTLALLCKSKYLANTEEGASIKVRSTFGIYYAHISDGKQSLTLNTTEWDQLLKNIPFITRSLLDLFYFRDFIDTFIGNVLADVDYQTDLLPSHVSDGIFCDVSLWKLS